MRGRLCVAALVIICLQLTSTGAQRYNAQRCTGRDCRKLSDCPWAQAEIKSGKNPDICGFVRREAMVCCPRANGNTPRPPGNTPRPPGNTPRPPGNTPRPPGNTPRPPGNTPRPPGNTPRPPNNAASTSAGIKSDAMCKKWSDLVVVYEDSPASLPWEDPDAKIRIDQCGKIEETLVVGGVSAKGREFPHMGSVGYKDNPIRFRCGCTLISEKFVLTAAHCSDGGTKLGPAKWVRLGELDTLSEVDEARPVVIGIRRIINHPRYLTDQGYNDIALYELEKEATFNAFVRPACLHTKWRIGHRTAVATGWGFLEDAGKMSTDLRKVNIKLVPERSCRSQYGSYSKIPQGISNDTMVCAGEEGKDTCQGDSGGPLQISTNEPYCSYAIIGVTSFGRRCGGSLPGVYTRVSAFVPWIESIVWP